MICDLFFTGHWSPVTGHCFQYAKIKNEQRGLEEVQMDQEREDQT